MKQIGVWLDKKTAHVVTLKAGDPTVEVIDSNLEFYNPKGGSRSKTRWGPQEVVQDSRYLEREKQQLKKYFEQLIEKISHADAILLFGPGQTALKFMQEIKSSQPELAARVIKVEKADSMTDNQVVAWVRNFFK